MMKYSRIPALLAFSIAASLSWRSAQAETIVIESRTTGGTTGGITANPPYLEVQGNWSGSGSHTIASGTTSGIGSRFASSAATPPVVKLTPTLQAGSTYRMSISHITINASPNLVVNITYEGCTGTATSTTNFNNAVGNVWETVADITVDAGVTQPSITFTYASGTLAGTGGRWYSDAFRFQNDSCIFSTLPELVGVTGPLAADQTFVNVPGVSSAATAVSVYANGTLVGQKSAGVTAGQNRVNTSPLVKGQVITATQTDANGVESCRPVSGPLVGGGANPRVRLALGIRQDITLNGPIGANGGGTSAIIKFLGATGAVNNVLGNAPAGTRFFYPSNEWQTVEFLRGEDPSNPVDPTFMWNGADATNPNQLKGNFGVLDSLDFAVDGDTGPYEIYIDSFVNGSTRIESFEDVAPGTSTVQFNQPNFSGTTSPFLLSQAAGVVSPNVSTVTNNTADDGSHCLFVSWQFKDTNQVNWLRLPAQGSGKPNPMLDLRLPISFRMRIMPVGQVPPPAAPSFTAGPGNRTVVEGGNVTLRANVMGSSPFTYQWFLNGVEIENATNSALTRSNVQLSDGGAYTLRASNALGTSTSPAGTLTVEHVPYTDVMTSLWQLAPGARRYLTNDGNTASIAFNPLSGNLLVATRSGSNAIQVLNGDTGTYLHTLQAPIGGYTGGTLALNLVACTDDGSVYAANVTGDGVTNNFRLYRWIGDAPEDVGALVWEGNPSGSADIHARWGDAMVVQGPSGDHEVLLTSATGAYISSIRPDFGSFVQLMDATGAASSSLRIGLALDGADTLWGKHLGLPLTRVTMDPNHLTATVAQTLSGVDNMTAIGVDPVNRLLAGVFVENPDNLRLFGIGANGLTPLDTEFFPTDNANANATGAVAFGPNRVYALDSNNGLIAMNLNLACLPDKLTIQRDGANVIISWNRLGQRLQGTADLGSGQWDEIAGPNQTSASVGAASGIKFFRLICP